VGRLPRAKRVAGQRRWRWEDVAPVIEEHRRSKPRGQSTPDTHQLARRPPDRSVLARAFFDRWEKAARHRAGQRSSAGVVEGLRGLGVEQLGCATVS
jgi:hypothetical protein